ncbi:CHAT domain-containing protein [Okeania hirsuta]|uniref:CHAT domain-containing protein n=1 Tax=Okeania hirsuta TaxID=1458930 RepID=A0A3N6PP12_9CYAN|nr:CHAT domain-containing protein [Okeania sp. SIO1F9]RQH25862.1 CHAT domain-containing protein [Okeania hirsuta]RQH33492.1 CHAT domain-containing protein [Okeania hirsuta]
MGILKLIAIALFGFCFSLGINFLSPILAQSSPSSLIQQGVQLLQQGRAEAALEVWQQAEVIYRKNKDRIGEIRSQVNQAQALTSMGFYRRSCDTVLQAFGNDLQCERLTESELQTVLSRFNTSNTNLNFQGLQSLGNGLRVLGKLALSQKVLEPSFPLVNSQNIEGRLLLNLGNTILSQAQGIANFRLRGKAERQAIIQGLSYYEKAVTVSDEELIKIQATINHLSLLLELNRQWQKSSGDDWLQPHVQFQIDTLPQIIGILNKINPSPHSIQATIKFAESLMNFEQINAKSTLVQLQTNFAELTLPNTINEQFLDQAIQQAKIIHNSRLEAYAIGIQGKLYQNMGKLENALNLTNQALAIAQKISASDIAYQLQEQLGDIFLQQGDSSKALLAYKSAFNTLQILRRNLVALNRDIQFDFRANIEPLYRKLVALLLQPELGSTQPKLSNIKAAQKVIESLQLAELDNFFQNACVNAEDINIDEIDKNAAVIYPILLDNQLSVILKLPGTENFRYASVSDKNFAAQFQDTLFNLRANITTIRGSSKVKLPSNQLYQWLIKPFEADLEIDLEHDTSQIKTLVFVLDGLLRNFPMSVLYDSDRERYLVERYAIAVVPGLQLVNPKPLLKEQLRVLTAGTSQKAPSYELEGFSSLPYIQQELDAIEKTVLQSEKLADEKFTKTNIQAQVNSEPFNIIHIATHGQFSSNPDDTFILGWEERINVRDLDLLLQTRNLTRSERAIELLILSACQTALGDTRAALGLAGVSIRAGARSVLGSLWNVNDGSTAELMKQFYQELLQSGSSQLRKAEALRQVQMKFIKGEIELNADYDKPYYWSSFILVGNWL